MKGKMVLYSILGFVILTVLIVGSWGMATGFKYFTAEKSGQAEAERQIQSAEFRIYSYNHFYDLLVAINSAEAQYDTQWELKEAQASDSTTYQKTLRNLAAIKAQIARLKVQYNADAEKEETIGQFRANNLPERVNTTSHEYGNRTGGL